jgi:hypothetical protein
MDWTRFTNPLSADAEQQIDEMTRRLVGIAPDRVEISPPNGRALFDLPAALASASVNYRYSEKRSAWVLQYLHILWPQLPRDAAGIVNQFLKEKKIRGVESRKVGQPFEMTSPASFGAQPGEIERWARDVFAPLINRLRA